jgi:hypothetical protein
LIVVHRCDFKLPLALIQVKIKRLERRRIGVLDEWRYDKKLSDWVGKTLILITIKQ